MLSTFRHLRKKIGKEPLIYYQKYKKRQARKCNPVIASFLAKQSYINVFINFKNIMVRLPRRQTYPPAGRPPRNDKYNYFFGIFMIARRDTLSQKCRCGSPAGIQSQSPGFKTIVSPPLISTARISRSFSAPSLPRLK